MPEPDYSGVGPVTVTDSAGSLVRVVSAAEWARERKGKADVVVTGYFIRRRKAEREA